jgi:protein phosphatase
MVRSSNEDAYGIYPDLSLYIVADGLGGHAGGEVASRIAVEAIREGIFRGCNTPSETKNHMIKTMKEAGEKIILEAERGHNIDGMGTTAVVVKIEEDKAIVAHVGDSRAYLVRGGTITQITKDHTVVEEYVRLGLLAPQDAICHPSRHILSRALGISGDVDVDTAEIRLTADDTMILCTDGLTNMLSERDMLDTILELRPSPEKITERLISIANKNGGIDNITVITICMIDAHHK